MGRLLADEAGDRHVTLPVDGRGEAVSRDFSLDLVHDVDRGRGELVVEGHGAGPRARAGEGASTAGARRPATRSGYERRAAEAERLSPESNILDRRVGGEDGQIRHDRIVE